MLRCYRFLVLLGTLLGLGCSTQKQLTYSSRPLGNHGVVVVEEVVDLGSRPLAAQEDLRLRSDGKLHVGEWFAVEGRHVGAEDVVVSIDGVVCKRGGFTKSGGVIVRVPTGLSPFRTHDLEIAHIKGTARQTLEVQNYLLVSDVGDSKIQAWTLSKKTELFSGEPWELNVEGLRAFSTSHDGSLLFAIGEDAITESESGAQRYPLVVIDLGAAGEPQRLYELPVELPSPPVDLALSLTDTQLFILTEKHFVALELDSEKLVGFSSIQLPTGAAEVTAYRQLQVVGKHVVAWEAYSNRLVLIEPTYQKGVVREPNRVVSSIDAAPSQVPSVVGIDGCSGADHLWVLTGPNTRFVGMGLRRLVTGELGKTQEVEPGGEASVQSPQGAPDLASDGGLQAELKEFELVHQANTAMLREVNRIALPEGFAPLALNVASCKRAYVSGVQLELLDPAARGGFSSMVKALGSSLVPGKIFSTSGQNLKKEYEGLGVFLGATQVPQTGELVHVGMRLAPRFVPPSIGVNWKLEQGDDWSTSLRAMNWTSTLPPYRAPALLVP